MDSYVQHWNALRNSYHADNANAPVNGCEGVSEYDFFKCDVKNYLCTASEANNGEFFLGDYSYEDTDNGAIEWSRKHDFLILEHQYKVLSADPQTVS